MIDIIEIILLVVIAVKVWGIVPQKLSRGKNTKLVVDSCGLIDGRIVELVASGFISQDIIIPEFVVHELQLLADGADSHKRERARFGLDIAKELQSRSTVVALSSETSGIHFPVDDQLVLLALKLKAQLYTTDFNLQKVAEIRGIKVLNINELSQNLRPVALPGERKTITILQKGSNPQQGIGYLEDGTMVVVENGAKHINKSVEVSITRTHQSLSGKMLFGEIIASSMYMTNRKRTNLNFRKASKNLPQPKKSKI